MKVAVLGVGGSGSAALRFLVMAGHEATGYEQFSLGHAMGSSHGNSRIIRRTYPDPFHTRMMARSYALWDELEREAGEPLFIRCGGITFGPADDPKVEATRLSLEEAGIGYELLSRDETRSRFPAIDIGEGATALFQSESGFLRASRCVLAQAGLAQTRGATIREHCAVLHVEEKNGRVFVSTASETKAFDAAIVTAGPWVGKLLAPLKLPVTTALRQILYVGIARNAENFLPGKMPVWIEEPVEYYGFPQDGVTDGIKLASHGAGMDFNPDDPERPVMPDHLEKALAHAMKRFPDLSGELIAAQSCLYTSTPDERFILDFAPGSQRVIVCSGCSGHGFKFTVLLGRIAADMATSGRLDEDAAPWLLERFG